MNLPKNLPRGWSGMGFTVRAGWLLAAHHARSYEEACSMLAKKRAMPAVAAVAPKNLWYLKD